MTKNCLLLLSLLATSTVAFAQDQPTAEPEPEKDYFALSLEELMSIPVSVASKSELTVRESPGIISVITEQEIKNSGARDLIDVLSLVPGIQFGGDVQDRKSTRLNSSHSQISYAVFCLKKKKKKKKKC